MENKLATIADKALDKIPVDKVYEDLAQAGLQKAGKALADILEIVTTPLLPLLHLKKRIAIYLDTNLRRYEEKLQEKSEEPSPVPELLGIPILQKLTLLNQGELSEAFLNLLTKASFDNSIHSVHPAFITALSDLSRDEAVILKSLNPKKSIPCLTMEINFMDKDTPDKYAFTKTPFLRLTGFEVFLDLHFPKNIELYIHNLERLGILTFDENDTLANRDDDYQKLEDLYKEDFEIVKGFASRESDKIGRKSEAKVNRRLLDITPFGHDFINACISD